MNHVWHKCEQPCEKPHCVYCEGGLAYCVVCKKGECELEPTCPGDGQPLEWKLRKLGENVDMLKHALELNREGGFGWNLNRPAMGKVKRPWQK